MDTRVRLNRQPFPAARFSAAVAVILAFSLAGCPSTPTGGTGGSTDNTPSDGAATTDVAMQGIAFVPKEVTIKKGGSVRWTNRDPVVHTVTSGDPAAPDNVGQLFDSGDIAAGGTFTHQFNEVGEFEYFCRPHQFMAAMRHAKVIVTE